MRILNMAQEYIVNLIMALMLVMFARAAWAGEKPTYSITVAMASTTITTAAYVQLDASLDASCASLDVANTGANPIYLAIGAASAENAIPTVSLRP